MHRSLSQSVHWRVVGAVFLLFALVSPGIGASQSIDTSTPESSPPSIAPPVNEPDIYLVNSLPIPSKEDPSQTLYLVRLEFGPDASFAAEHRHLGQFVLTVNSGAICYTVGNLDASTEVTAILPASPETHELCPTSTLKCDPPDEFTGEQFCELKDGDSIYLPTNGSISQTGTGRHSYGIVDDIPATVHISGLQKGSPDSAPCGGGCH